MATEESSSRLTVGKTQEKNKAQKYPLVLKLVLFSQQHTKQLQEKESYLPIFQLESPSMGIVPKRACMFACYSGVC